MIADALNNFFNTKLIGIIVSLINCFIIIGTVSWYQFNKNKKPEQLLVIQKEKAKKENKFEEVNKEKVKEEDKSKEEINQKNKETKEETKTKEEIDQKVKKTKEEAKEIVEYIPVVDCYWLNILILIVITIIAIILSFIFAIYYKDADGDAWSDAGLALLFCLLEFALCFLTSMILAGFSKIWDKEHTWWQNTTKCFFHNVFYKNLGFFLLGTLVLAIIILAIYLWFNEKIEAIKYANYY